MSKNKNVKLTDDGVTMYFERKLPNQVPRGHNSHRSGAGLHGQRKKVRVRGNQAKRQWLENDN